jgi:molybdopterin converting factor small subunit
MQTGRGVIEKIDELEGKGFKKKVMGTEVRPGGSIRILLNGKLIDALKRFDTEVKNGDEMAFFPFNCRGLTVFSYTEYNRLDYQESNFEIFYSEL